MKKEQEVDPFDYKQLGKSVKETKRRAYDAGLLMSVLERMADLETELETLRRDVKQKDNYNKLILNTMVRTMRKFAKRMKVALPGVLDHTKQRKEFEINGEDDESPLQNK